MENWEFLLQRKGDKSWLPLESPTVEILEGQYRLAARSNLANVPVEIAIAYRPLADVRHQPIHQKVVKRISHDGLLIVMPYTSFGPGLWQIDCGTAEADPTNETATWRKTLKFDVIQISSEAGSEWQYSDLPEEELEAPTEIPTTIHTNALGIDQTEPTPLSYSSPILDIAEQRSTELVQSMFEEFALFGEENNDEIGDEDQEFEPEREILSDRATLQSASQSASLLEQVNLDNPTFTEEIDAPLPRILLRLLQPQYLVNADNSFTLTGEAYTNGEIEVSLKDPQTLDVIVNVRYAIASSNEHSDHTLSDRRATTGAIPFSYQVIVPPPSEIQVLIGDVQIHPQQDFQQYSDLFIMQQAIAVSYPASRVLPELIKEAEKYNSQNITQNITQNIAPNTEESINYSSYPQSPQSFPQVSKPAKNRSKNLLPKSKPASLLSLPPLPSNQPKTSQGKPEAIQSPANALSLPPLPPLHNSPPNKDTNQTFNFANSVISEDYAQSFPQVEVDELQEIELEFANTDFSDLANSDRAPLSTSDDEPELLYSFEEELPHNYQELLEQPRFETLPSFNHSFNNSSNNSQNNSRDRSNRFLNKLQTLSAEAIAAQKANQRTEELLLETFPSSDPLLAPEEFLGVSIDLDNPEQTPLTIAEVNSFAELDFELDVELDRLLAPEPDLLILNEYVWEEAIDPNTFPIRTVSSSNSTASLLSETAQTIRNIQESSAQSISDQSISEQEAIPIPDIIIPAGEIISGTPMLVTVRLPAIAPKFFVKFWIKDLQTRMIVDGPRWLLDFSKVPDTEFIETRTNISIPLSSIDVAFEAIAIEAQTQRESHKVRVTRAVTPPNLAQDINSDYD